MRNVTHKPEKVMNHQSDELSNLSGYMLVSWYTTPHSFGFALYPGSSPAGKEPGYEAILVHKQASLYQLHHPHHSQQLCGFLHLCDSTSLIFCAYNHCCMYCPHYNTFTGLMISINQVNACLAIQCTICVLPFCG